MRRVSLTRDLRSEFLLSILQAVLCNFTGNSQAAQSAALKWISMLMGKCPTRVVVFEDEVRHVLRGSLLVWGVR